ncbi:MAG: type II secretion system F family protein [Planctomycetota bacterium]
MLTYRYAVQTPTGQTLDGVIRAANVDEAQDALEASSLRVLTLEKEKAGASIPLKGTDFLAFNQQLAQLTKVGLPLESGLRLIAQDLRRGRLSSSIKTVVDELERGTDLADAFARHSDRFPKLYSRVVAAGIESNNLSAVLMNLSRHLELTQRLRSALWRAASYPLIVLISFVAVLVFIGTALIPQFAEIYQDFDTSLPALTLFLIEASAYTWPLAIGFTALLLALPTLSLVTRLTGQGGWLRDQVLMRLPLVGPALNRNLMARWCDMLRVGVSAGMDLPAALQLSGQVVGSRRAQDDTQRLIDVVESGGTLDDSVRLSLIPASVPAAIQLAAEQADLAALVGDLSVIYEQQAEIRLAGIQTYLGPALLLVLGLLMGLTATALFLPLVKLMQSIM